MYRIRRTVVLDIMKEEGKQKQQALTARKHMQNNPRPLPRPCKNEEQVELESVAGLDHARPTGSKCETVKARFEKRTYLSGVRWINPMVNLVPSSVLNPGLRLPVGE